MTEMRQKGLMPGAIAGLVLATLVSVAHAAPSDLEGWLAQSWTREGYLPLAAADSPGVEALFAAALENHPETEALAVALGMRVEPAGGGIRVLRESGRREGRGIYFFRDAAAARPLALQAPHARADRDSGRLAARLMQGGRARALAVNSAPRYLNEHSDVAHQAESWMMAFTRAFARAFPAGRIVQLHGFAAGKRTTTAGRTADVIVSPGHREDSLDALRTAECLRRSGQETVRLYPHEVTELGGTTNAMAGWLRAAGFTGFLHLELGAARRQQLLRDEGMLQSFGLCLETFP